ncbi:anthranilate synthase component I [Aquibacillus sp. 3ASR75-11]|uniref:Anthranilate synthase component 1 n=1 Tax=Terrihalobacillus insolitus TaxID=2950438 RepID=A0A9X3WTH0_9BACI|nr:anthranilate synthase component I [Terrihalobacillus insolitus]MDC3425652.1 anthranilate synthase component I [Terrihalobacillus insolitus]
MGTTGTQAISYKTRDIVGDTLTPIAVFNRLKGTKKFLLESSAKLSEKGRYSFIGANPYKEIVGRGTTTTCMYTKENREEVEQGRPLDIVKRHIPQIDLQLPFAFYGGAIGYIGYDSIRAYEAIGEEPDDQVGMPDVHLMFYQDVIIFDHVKQTVSIVAINVDGKRSEDQLEERITQIQSEIVQDKQATSQRSDRAAFKPMVKKEAFLKMVDQAKQRIIAGDIFQVVLSQRMKATFESDPFTFYRSLRRSNPSPYMFYIDFDDYTVLGASPESLIKTQGDQIITNPIAGTRRRGKTKEEDDALAEELLLDEKELAEHKMLVDLSRNDLGRVCEIGSITIPKYMTIERYQHVMHIVSEVQGTLDKTHSPLDALISTLPAGTVSGAPKIRAMQIINELEKQRRGVYAGSVGYINFNGDLDFALAIRTLVIKNNEAYVQAGAGIVYDSDPEKEYEETLNKAKSLLEVEANDFID